MAIISKQISLSNDKDHGQNALRNTDASQLNSELRAQQKQTQLVLCVWMLNQDCEWVHSMRSLMDRILSWSEDQQRLSNQNNLLLSEDL